MSAFWIKLYHEVLDDPKMGMLDDHLWRRIVELFLLAGRQNDNGRLPPLAQMAYTLRCDPAALARDLLALEPTSIVARDEQGWYVPQFTKRQAKSTSTERSREFRKRQRMDNDDATETQQSCDVHAQERIERIDTDTDTEREERENAPAAPAANEGWVVGFAGPETLSEARAIMIKIKYAWRVHMQPHQMNSIIEDEFSRLIYKYPESWIIQALEITGKKHKALNYTIGILERMAEDERNGVKRSDYEDFIER